MKNDIEKEMMKCKKLKEAEITDQEANNLLAEFTN